MGTRAWVVSPVGLPRRLAVAALGGLAAGVLAYRYGALPNAYDGPHAHVLLAMWLAPLAIAVTMVMGRYARLRRSQPVTSLIIFVGALAIGRVAAAWIAPTLDRVPLAHHELAGVSIDLPDGVVTDASHSDVAGSYEVHLEGTRALVLLSWGPPLPEPDGADGALQSAASYFNQTLTGGMLGSGAEDLPLMHLIGAEERGSGGENWMGWLLAASVRTGPALPSLSAVVYSDLYSGMITRFTCDGRSFELATASGHGAVLDLHRRIAATIACTPSHRRAAAALPVVLDLPPGWTQIRADATASEYRAGARRLQFRAVDPTIFADHAGEQRRGAIDDAFGRSAPTRATSSWLCDGVGVIGAYTGDSEADAKSGADLLSRVRCTGP